MPKHSFSRPAVFAGFATRNTSTVGGKLALLAISLANRKFALVDRGPAGAARQADPPHTP